MTYRPLLEQRRKRLEKTEAALDLVSDPDVQAQLAGDPEMRAAFISAIGGTNGTASPNAGQRQPSFLMMEPPPGSLLGDVLNGAKQMKSDFTTQALIHRMTSQGYRFAAQDAQVAAGSALKELAARGFLQMVVQGRGRRASVFRYIKEEGEE